MTRRLRLILFALTTALAALAQTMATPPRTDPNSYNHCNVYQAPEPFRWSVMASDPVDIPIVDFATLVAFLSPSNAKAVAEFGSAPLFDKPWQLQAKAGWKWTDAELYTLWFAAKQGEGSNWRREMIRPCTILGDMMHGRNTALVGRPTLVDFTDNGSREAWVFPIREDLEAVFFKDCSNPSYWVKIPQAADSVAALPPKPQEAPPLPALDVCKNIAGAKTIPPGYVWDANGNCVPQAMQAPPVVIQSPTILPQPSNATAGAFTLVQVNAASQPAGFLPPLATVSRSSQFPLTITVKAEVTVKHVSACEGKACPGWTYGFRNFGQGLGAMGTGFGVAYMPFALKSGMIRSSQAQAEGAVRAAEARRPDIVTITNTNTFDPTFNPTNTNNPTITPTFNGPTYTPPTYTPPVYNPPIYYPPAIPPSNSADLCPNIPGIQTALPGPDWNIIGGECKPPGNPPPRP